MLPHTRANLQVTFQLPSHELAHHAARPRLLHLELWQGHLLISSSVLLLLPPYLPSTAAELQRLPWGSEDKEEESLSFVTDLGLWLEDNELMSRDQQFETSQEAQACSEPWHSGSALLRQAVLWAMPALGELLLESLVTLPCAPLSPFAHLAHVHPPQCCSGSRGGFASKRSLSQHHSPTARPLMSSKHTAHSASAPSPSAEWRGAEAEEAAFLQGPLSSSAQGSAGQDVRSARRSSESVSSWSSHKERKDGLLHLALLSPQPIDMMMYLLFWGR
ncbi:hypothetical protein DUNSADRAFT_17699 [Dunaliella salina]|uniref:Encoded protein n=1 Tax=Dunaliella salina TaxID=3046 RepID=A0ABQ7G197_DUNSA|nr:hypothetical protein DUNSADRAFT_17699 [Dunaliella salina]|eukprot:KAF5828374.1 hypothetical protein DUNSADRAFT_17699 [Dunaliella salina]